MTKDDICLLWCLWCKNIKVTDNDNHGKRKKGKKSKRHEIGTKGHSEGAESNIFFLYSFLIEI